MNEALDNILARHTHTGREALIPLLQEVQESLGFLSPEGIVAIARHLSLPASKVFGVATFYNQFRFQPQGRYHIQLCRGTACHVKGSATLARTLESELKVQAGQTTRDGLFSLEVVACIGACGLAPVLAVNGEFHAGMTPEKTRRLVASLRRAARAASKEEASHDTL